MWTPLGGAGQPIAHDGLHGMAQHRSAQVSTGHRKEEATQKATVSCHQLRLPRFELAGEAGEGLSAPSCLPRDPCQMRQLQGKGEPWQNVATTHAGRHRAGGRLVPSPSDDLPAGLRSSDAARGLMFTRCHLEVTRGSITAPWKGWAVIAEPGCPSGHPQQRDSQGRKPHGDQWRWKRSPAYVIQAQSPTPSDPTTR